MFEIRHAPQSIKNFKYDIYLRKKNICNAAFNEDENIVSTDGYVDFDIKKIALIKAKKFNDNFCFKLNTEQIYEDVFDMFDILRKGNTIRITIYGSLNVDDVDLDWLLWNPLKFVHEA